MIYTDGHPVNMVQDLFASTARCNEAYTHLSIVRSDVQEMQIFYKRNNLTSNECELYALIHACALAEEGEEIRSDSVIAIGYTKDYFLTKINPHATTNKAEDTKKVEARARMNALGCMIRSLVELKNLRCTWIPREENPIT